MTEQQDPKVVLVTGASRGIGLEIARSFVAQGHHVVGTATTAAGADNIAAALQQDNAPGTAQGLEMTAADPESTAAVFSALKDSCGAPAIVVNNAGLTRDNLLLRMSEEEWSTVLEANLSLSFRVCKAALRAMMKARWGRIVNISSVVGRSGNPGQSNYAASKAGLEGFTRALALEVSSRNITVNAVAPGFIETDMTASLTAEQTEQLLARVPAGRMGRADEVAAAVQYLCSDQAGYMTGETLHLNGGMHLN
ncbi:MAG: 3-oxoacyl-[acyl-carrier-protein] reductase [Pseudomonadales bacterium]